MQFVHGASGVGTMNTGWSAGEDDSGQKISEESLGGECGRVQDEEMKREGEEEEGEVCKKEGEREWGREKEEGEGGRAVDEEKTNCCGSI